MWRKTGNGYEYNIRVPSGCTADIILADGRKASVGAGEYNF